MDDSALPVTNIPGWMQIGVSFAVFIFATMGAIWGYVRRESSKGLLQHSDDSSATLVRIESLLTQLVDNQNSRQRTDDLNRVVGEAVQHALESRARKIRDQESS